MSIRRLSTTRLRWRLRAVTLTLACCAALLSSPQHHVARAEPGVAVQSTWAVLLCKFADRDVEPRTLDGYRRQFTAAGAGTGGFYDFWLDQSYGQHRLDATVLGWYRLGVTEAEYNSWGFDRPRKAQACMDAAVGVNLRAYDGIIVVTNTPGDYTGFPYERRFDGQVKRWSVAILNGTADVGPAIQEMAHGYALGHSWSTETPGIPASTCPPECEYGDKYDVMSTWSPLSFPGTYGGSGPGFNAHNREWFGWLQPARIATHPTANCTSCTASYRLADLNTPATAGKLMVKVPTTRPGHYFTLEYRRPLGWDRNFPRAAVLIHEVRPNGIGYLVKRFRGSGEWLPGQRFAATAPTPFTVAITANKTNASVTVTVSRPAEANRWTRIGGALKDVTPGGAGVYALDPANGNLLQYAGTGERWPGIGSPGSRFAANDRYLVATDPSGESVLLFDGRAWHRIGGPAARLIVGGQSIYAVQPGTGDLWRYDGVPFRWTKVGGPGAQFVVNETGLYALSSDRRNVLRYRGTPGVWETILVGGARELVVTSTKLFAISAANGDISRYDGTAGAWTRIGGPGSQFVGNKNGLYALTPDRAAIMRWTGTSDQWQQIGGAASSIAAAGTHLYMTNTWNDAVFIYGN